MYLGKAAKITCSLLRLLVPPICIKSVISSTLLFSFLTPSILTPAPWGVFRSPLLGKPFGRDSTSNQCNVCVCLYWHLLCLKAFAALLSGQCKSLRVHWQATGRTNTTKKTLGDKKQEHAHVQISMHRAKWYEAAVHDCKRCVYRSGSESLVWWAKHMNFDRWFW